MNAMLRMGAIGIFLAGGVRVDVGAAMDPSGSQTGMPPLVLGLVPARPAQAHTVAPVIDLLTAGLREEPGLALVERRDLDKALDELARSAASAEAGGELPLELGALVKADLVGLFEWQGAVRRVAFRLDSVRHGVRLVQGEYPYRGSGDTAAADVIRADIRRALRKLRRAPANAVRVNLAGFRAIEPGLRSAAMARTAHEYLRERLLAQDGLLLAVRDDLASLQREQDMKPDGAPAWERTGAVIEGDVAMHGDAFRLTVWIVRGAGCAEDCLTIALDPLSARAALEDAVAWMVKRLLDTPPSAAGPGPDEVARLVQEADRSGDAWERKYRLLATAHLLNPSDAGVFRRLLKSMPSDQGALLADTQRMTLDLLREAHEAGLLPPADLLDAAAGIWSYCGSWQSVVSPDVAAKNSRLRRDCRRFAEQVYAAWRPASRAKVHASIPWLCYPCQWKTFLADTPELALAAVTTWFLDELMARVSRDGGWSPAWSQALDYILQEHALAFGQRDSRFGAESMQVIWNGFLTTLAQHADPYVRTAAERSRLEQERNRNLPYRIRRALARPYDPGEHLVNLLIEQAAFSEADGYDTILSGAAWNVGLHGWLHTPPTSIPATPEPARLPCSDGIVLFDLRDHVRAVQGKHELPDALSGICFEFEDFRDTVQSLVVGDHVWLRCVLRDRVLVLRLNLSARTREACWSVPVPRHPVSDGGGIAPGLEATYVGLGSGIAVLPGAAVSGEAWLDDCPVIDERAGLPAGEVTALARLGDRLYVGLGRGLLGEYDLPTRRWNTLASSESRDRACPLNREHPFRISSMLPSADGARVFFVCEQADRNNPEREHPVDGVWTVDTASGRITQWWRGHAFWPYAAPRLIPDGPMMRLITRDSIMRFDPVTGASVVLYGEASVSPAASMIPAPDISRAGPGPSPKITGVQSMVGACQNTVWWWAGGGQAACLSADQPGAAAYRLDCTALPPEERYIVYLCTVPQGVILVARHCILLISGVPGAGLIEKDGT